MIFGGKTKNSLYILLLQFFQLYIDLSKMYNEHESVDRVLLAEVCFGGWGGRYIRAEERGMSASVYC